MRLGPEVLRDPRRAAHLEWLHADGLGGHAASSVIGLHTRRAHGWLVTPTQPGAPAQVLLTRFEDALEAGPQRIELSVSAYPDVLHPRGYEQLAEFACTTLPTWTFDCGQARLTRCLARVHGEPGLVVSYLLEGPRPAWLELRPMLAYRGVSDLQHENARIEPAAQHQGGVLICAPYEDSPALHIQVPAATWHADGYWYRNCEYVREREVGRPYQEDVFSPGRLRVELHPGRALAVLVWVGAPPARADALALLERERQRQRALRLGSDGLVGQLRRAADAFVVREASGAPAIVSNYFEGSRRERDGLVALPGLLLETRPLGPEARACAPGLLASLADEERSPELVLRAGWLLTRVLVATPAPVPGERDWRPAVLPAFAAALERLVTGRVGLGSLATNGLVLGPDGRAEIDVQALWFNLLLAAAELLRVTRAAGLAVACGALAGRLRDTVLRSLWCAERGHLADALTPQGPDFTLRPRQLLALSLPHALLPRDRAERVLRAVEQALLTPCGLRTLAPDAPGYLGTGDLALAPAQGRGSVWPELMYDYFEALLRVHGEHGRQAGRAWLQAFEPHLAEGVLGHIAGAFDGDAPHAPSGPPAQAAAVAEILRLSLRLGPPRPSR